MKRVRGEDSEQGAARSGSQLRWEVVQSRVLPPTSRQAVAAAKSVEQPAGPVAETLPPGGKRAAGRHGSTPSKMHRDGLAKLV